MKEIEDEKDPDVVFTRDDDLDTLRSSVALLSGCTDAEACRDLIYEIIALHCSCYGRVVTESNFSSVVEEVAAAYPSINLKK